MGKMVKVGVVVLNYKVAKQAVRAINSVLESEGVSVSVVAVDNNSGDDFEERLKAKDVVFVQTGKNLGYTGGNNVGIKEALKKGVEYVLILNPDTLVKKDSLAKLVFGMAEFGGSIASPKIYFMDSKIIWYAGGIFDLRNVLGSHRGVDVEDTGQFDQIGETDYATGAAMMVKREVFEKIGFFDERYFLYYEDSDFCYRAKRAGFKIIYVPKAVVWHANAQSTGLGTPRQDYYITRNRLLFGRKFLGPRTNLALLREAIRHLKNRVRRKALMDFLLNRFGNGNI